MTTLAQLRKAALNLPEVEEVEEESDLAKVAFAVGGERFAWATGEGETLLALTEDALAPVLERFPAARQVTTPAGGTGVSLPLAAVNGMDLNSLVYRAWQSRAPAALVSAARAAKRGEAPQGPDALPSSIGKPATRALLLAGVKTLDDVAARSEAELLALHGVGPRAIRLLREALAQRGRTLR